MTSRREIVETGLGIKLPDQYAAFLNRYGCFMAGGVDFVDGICEDLFEPGTYLGVVHGTKSLRESEDIPHDWLVIRETQDGLILLDTERGVVYEWWDYDLTKVADSFNEWFEHHIMANTPRPDEEPDEYGTLWFEAHPWRKHIVEQELGVTIPRDYELFLYQYGFYTGEKMCVFGVYEHMVPDDRKASVIALTRHYRETRQVPHKYLVIWHAEDEDHLILLDTETGAVVDRRGEKFRVVSESFADWFATTVKPPPPAPHVTVEESWEPNPWRKEIVEKELGVVVPEDYGRHLIEYGVGGPTYGWGKPVYGMIEWIDDLGVDRDPNVIAVTRRMREERQLPHQYLVLRHSDEDEQLVVLDTVSGRVLELRGGEYVEVAQSFDAWFDATFLALDRAKIEFARQRLNFVTYRYDVQEFVVKDVWTGVIYQGRPGAIRKVAESYDEWMKPIIDAHEAAQREE